MITMNNINISLVYKLRANETDATLITYCIIIITHNTGYINSQNYIYIYTYARAGFACRIGLPETMDLYQTRQKKRSGLQGVRDD